MDSDTNETRKITLCFLLFVLHKFELSVLKMFFSVIIFSKQVHAYNCVLLLKDKGNNIYV